MKVRKNLISKCNACFQVLEEEATAYINAAVIRAQTPYLDIRARN